MEPLTMEQIIEACEKALQPIRCATAMRTLPPPNDTKATGLDDFLAGFASALPWGEMREAARWILANRVQDVVDFDKVFHPRPELLVQLVRLSEQETPKDKPAGEEQKQLDWLNQFEPVQVLVGGRLQLILKDREEPRAIHLASLFLAWHDGAGAYIPWVQLGANHFYWVQAEKEWFGGTWFAPVTEREEELAAWIGE